MAVAVAVAVAVPVRAMPPPGVPAIPRPVPHAPVSEVTAPASLDVVTAVTDELVPASEPEAPDVEATEAVDSGDLDDTDAGTSIVTSATHGGSVRRRKRRGKA